MTELFKYPASEITISAELQTTFSQIYHYVRDLPFDCSNLPERPQSVMDSNRILENYGRGSCSAKHYLLGARLEDLDLNTRYLTFPFQWESLSVDYPKDLKELAKKMPVQYHCALGLIFEGQGCLLDATWDPQLSKAGFTVNQGIALPFHNTLGVNPCGEPIIHQNSGERWDYILKLKKQMPRNEIVPIFYQKLSEWLQSIRC